jgi:nicotinamide-nucleotide amidase
MGSELESGFKAAVEQLAQGLGEREMMLAAAESCTGGWLAKVCTDMPGSSKWFERGFVTYTNESKQEMLGVSAHTLRAYGAVSEQTVAEMAAGALANSRAQIAVSISGIAGPGGGTLEKPVGTVCFGWARETVRAQAVHHALQGLLKLLP